MIAPQGISLFLDGRGVNCCHCQFVRISQDTLNLTVSEGQDLTVAVTGRGKDTQRACIRLLSSIALSISCSGGNVSVANSSEAGRLAMMWSVHHGRVGRSPVGKGESGWRSGVRLV